MYRSSVHGLIDGIFIRNNISRDAHTHSAGHHTTIGERSPFARRLFSDIVRVAASVEQCLFIFFFLLFFLSFFLSLFHFIDESNNNNIFTWPSDTCLTPERCPRPCRNRVRADDDRPRCHTRNYVSPTYHYPERIIMMIIPYYIHCTYLSCHK